ncbi:hypothetical protein HDU67_007404 [Dinochytrium kinnereticum]|nr:hypothetical protein HDU67_007404 [Dinochytrium kinnereticum]
MTFESIPSSNLSRQKSRSNPVFSPDSLCAAREDGEPPDDNDSMGATPVRILADQGVSEPRVTPETNEPPTSNPSSSGGDTPNDESDLKEDQARESSSSADPQAAGWDSGLAVQGKEAEAFIFALNNIVARGRRASVDSRAPVGEAGSGPVRTSAVIESPSYPHPIALSLSVSSETSDNELDGSGGIPAQSQSLLRAKLDASGGLAMRHRQPIIDCSDLFPDAIGEQTGLFVFRIENMRPEILPLDQFGRFCVADCYIVLSSTEADSGEAHADASKLIHKIWTWIGKEAEMDKRFCCAMYAVGLKNAIGGFTTETEESSDFAELFGGSLEHLDGSFATESGLFVTEKTRQYPLRLYRIQGKINVFLQLVAPSSSSLESSNVYLIDAGLEIVQWNGSTSSLGGRSKCRMLCESINASERVGRAQIFEMNEGEEDEWLWDILDGLEDHSKESGLPEATVYPSTVTLYRAPALTGDELSEEALDPVKNVVVSNERLKRTMLKSDGCFVLDVGCEVFLWIGLAAKPEMKVVAGEMMARVIRLSDRPPWLALHRAIDGHEPESFKLRFQDWAELDPARKLLLRPEQKPSTLPGIEVDVQALYTVKNSFGSMGTLAAEESTIEETFKRANQRLVSMTLFMHDRGGRFIRVPSQEQEHLWNGDAYLFLCVYRKNDAGRPSTASLPRSEVNDDKAIAGGDEPSVASSLHGSKEDLASSEMDAGSEEEETGDAMSSVSESVYDDTEDVSNDADAVDCIVYFWEGRKASRVAFSAFRFQAQSEMENLVRGMYGCGVSVIQTVQGREPVELLAHLGNRVVVYRGNRKNDRWRMRSGSDTMATMTHHLALSPDDKLLSDKPHSQTMLFHIRTEGRYRTTRAVEISPVSMTSLVSRDCFLVCRYPMLKSESSFAFLWVGRGARRDDVRNAKEVADRIVSVLDPNENGRSSLVDMEKGGQASASPSSAMSSPETLQVPGGPSKSSGRFRIVSEKLEPKAFWECFIDGHLRLSSATIPSPMSPTPSINSTSTAGASHLLRSMIVTGVIPRFLLCTCSSGNFRVIEVSDFVQSDLDTTTCAIVDPGPPENVFVWCGVEASDVVRTLTRKAVEVWVRETNRSESSDIEDMGCVVWVEEGMEGPEFRSAFLGWEEGGAAAGKRVKDPGNLFKREEEMRKRSLNLKKAETVNA